MLLAAQAFDPAAHQMVVCADMGDDAHRVDVSPCDGAESKIGHDPAAAKRAAQRQHVLQLHPAGRDRGIDSAPAGQRLYPNRTFIAGGTGIRCWSLGPEPLRRAGGIHGHISASDNRNTPAHVDGRV